MNALPQVRTVSAEEIRALLIAEIAVIQKAIAAVEAVVVDLDTEVIASMLSERRPRKPAFVC